MQVLDNLTQRRYKVAQSGIGFVRLQEASPLPQLKTPRNRFATSVKLDDVDSYWFTRSEFERYFTPLH